MIGKLPEVFQTREIWENIIRMTQFRANVRQITEQVHAAVMLWILFRK
jgi:hypothetical protein